MADRPKVAVVVPVAFFTPEHVGMTDRFLTGVRQDLPEGRIGLWHNGGDLDADGQDMLDRHAANPQVFDARGWGFFRMWNAGIRWAQALEADVALVLNNDIDWPIGALAALAAGLYRAPSDIAIASPDPASAFVPGALVDINATPAYRGLLGWAFAVRPTMWQWIDDRYQVWYGDDELGLLMAEAGWRCVRAKGIPIGHPPSGETTMSYRPNVWELRSADEALYNSKWHADVRRT